MSWWESRDSYMLTAFTLLCIMFISFRFEDVFVVGQSSILHLHMHTYKCVCGVCIYDWRRSPWRQKIVPYNELAKKVFKKQCRHHNPTHALITLLKTLLVLTWRRHESVWWLSEPLNPMFAAILLLTFHLIRQRNVIYVHIKFDSRTPTLLLDIHIYIGTYTTYCNFYFEMSHI